MELGAARSGSRFQGNLSLDEVAELAADQPGAVRAFVGYSGWSAGQLEDELEQKSWVLVKPDKRNDATLGHERVWHKIMNELGPVYKLQAALPDDVTLN